MKCPHCHREIASIPLAKGFMRGSTLLKNIAQSVADAECGQRFTMAEIREQYPGEPKKQIYNAIGYLKRHGALVSSGYAQFTKPLPGPTPTTGEPHA